MKVWINSDEWYPVYEISREKIYFPDAVIKITEKQFNKWNKVFKEFEAVQEELRKYCD